jgi:hypothetical protein
VRILAPGVSILGDARALATAALHSHIPQCAHGVRRALQRFCAAPSPRAVPGVVLTRRLVLGRAAGRAWCAARLSSRLRQASRRADAVLNEPTVLNGRAMTFFDLCVAVLLFFNAAAVLNEHRFLAKREYTPHARRPRHLSRFFVRSARRWLVRTRLHKRGRTRRPQLAQGAGAGHHHGRVVHEKCAWSLSARTRSPLTCRAAHVVPLIAVNVVVILVKLVFG